MLQEMDSDELDDHLQDILHKMGVNVISELPSYIKAHPHVGKKYVFSPTYMGVLKCLVKLTHTHGLEGVVDKVQHLSVEDKQKLCQVCAKISSYELKADYKMFLQQLPLFQTRKCSNKSTSKFVSVSEVNLGAPNDSLPIHISRDLLELSNVDSMNLGILLEVKQLSMVELLTQVNIIHLYPMVELLTQVNIIYLYPMVELLTQVNIIHL